MRPLMRPFGKDMNLEISKMFQMWRFPHFLLWTFITFSNTAIALFGAWSPAYAESGPARDPRDHPNSGLSSWSTERLLHGTYPQSPQIWFTTNPKKSGGFNGDGLPGFSSQRISSTPLEPSPLEDILLEEGVLSSEQWMRIKAVEEQRLADRTDAIELMTSPRWYERLRMYGFIEIRYNRLGQPKGDLISWLDGSVGKRLGDDEQFDAAEPGGLVLRRARLVVAGQISDRVSIYLQPDFASEVDGELGGFSLRDAWGQYAFDSQKEWRLRVGLQRVPCSFDSWQSSRQRVAIDRADATASCMPNNRDLAISLQYTPQIAQYRWKQMVDYLYGAGDYGMINFTVFNGQGANQPERNSNKHFGLRLAYPFEFWGGRLFEAGLNAMTGQYSVDMGDPSNTSIKMFSLTEDKTFERRNFDDRRVNAYVYFPPQPFGFLAEYVRGEGPERGEDGIVREKSFSGGYVQLQYLWKYSDIGTATFYGGWQKYNGGLKFATGAPDVKSQAWEFGVAWMPDPQWEVTLAYAFTKRTNFERTKELATGFCDSSFNDTRNEPPTTNVQCVPGQQFTAKGNLLRLQLQWYFN
jgi:hypothetical protein